jgi:hypothetical protein
MRVVGSAASTCTRGVNPVRAGRMATVAAAGDRAEGTTGPMAPAAPGGCQCLRQTNHGRSRGPVRRWPGDGRSSRRSASGRARRDPVRVRWAVSALRPSAARSAAPHSAVRRPGSTSHPSFLGRACAVPRASGLPPTSTRSATPIGTGAGAAGADRAARPEHGRGPRGGGARRRQPVIGRAGLTYSMIEVSTRLPECDRSARYHSAPAVLPRVTVELRDQRCKWFIARYEISCPLRHHHRGCVDISVRYVWEYRCIDGSQSFHAVYLHRLWINDAASVERAVRPTTSRSRAGCRAGRSSG